MNPILINDAFYAVLVNTNFRAYGSVLVGGSHTEGTINVLLHGQTNVIPNAPSLSDLAKRIGQCRLQQESPVYSKHLVVKYLRRNQTEITNNTMLINFSVVITSTWVHRATIMIGLWREINGLEHVLFHLHFVVNILSTGTELRQTSGVVCQRFESVARRPVRLTEF